MATNVQLIEATKAPRILSWIAQDLHKITESNLSILIGY